MSRKEKPPKTGGKRKKKKLILFLGIPGFLLVLLLVSAQVTSQSKFCSVCHYMKPFYKSWQESSHKDVECSKCHYAPGLRSKVRAKFEGLVMVGRYWTKLYLKSKPWAEIDDESCLKSGCHDKRLLEGRVKFKEVAFDHTVHFTDLKRGKNLKCTSCHSQIVQGEHITVTESSCFICHFKESEHYPRIADCSHCHIQEDLVSPETSKYNHRLVFANGFSCDKCHTHTLLGDGAVPHENCYKCHWEQDRFDKFSDTDLMHATHIAAHKIECNQCHLEIQHKIVRDIASIADCRNCHTGTHEAQKILFTGQGGKGTTRSMPNVMLESGLSCKACHIFHEGNGEGLLKSGTLTSKEAACESCHGKGFGRLMRGWQSSTERRLARVKQEYARAEEEVRKAGRLKDKKTKNRLDEAAFNIDVVERGKSVHNASYSQELLRAALVKIAEALQAAGSKYAPETALFQEGAVPTLCVNCHTGIEDVSARVFGLGFSHRIHVAEKGMACDSCHSNVRKHGELTATKASCASCHHQDTKQDCSRCHRIQKAVYEGEPVDGLRLPRDIMAEAGAACQDCHLDDKGKIFRSSARACVDCHEDAYGEMFSEWRTSVRTLLRTLEDKIKSSKRLRLAPEEVTILRSAEKTLETLKNDGSSGLHNFAGIEDHLSQAIQRIQALGKRKDQ